MKVLVHAAQHIFCWRQRLINICVSNRNSSASACNLTLAQQGIPGVKDNNAATCMPGRGRHVAAVLSQCCKQGFGMGWQAHHL